MTFSIYKIHKTEFEKRPAKEKININDLQLVANSVEYGNDEKQRMKWLNYIKSYNNEFDYIIVPYKASKKHIGRLEAELSMCDEWGCVRALLCDDLYWDIDGVNMGYQIFYQSYTMMTSEDRNAKELSTIKNFIDCRDYWTNLVYDQYFKLYDKEDPNTKFKIKQLFIRLLNGGTVNKWKKDFGVLGREEIPMIGLLDKEIKYATKMLFDYLPAFKIKANSSEKDTISHFIYETEKKCVEQLYIALGCPETYMYCKDGIMVLQSEFTKNRVEAIIEQARENIFLNYALYIDFKIKPMVKDYNLDELTERDDLGDTNLLAIHTERLNKEYAKIKSVEAFAYKAWDGEIKFMTKSALINQEMDCAPMVKVLKWSNMHQDNKIMEVRIIDEWLLDCNKPKFEDIGIYPHDTECPATHYNTWTPFLASTYKECPADECIDELEFLLNHMLILCNHEEVIYNYFIRWFGQMLKYPSTKTHAPTFISEEGAGKGSLFELFRRVLGDSKVLETTKPDLVLGQFNDLLVNAFLVIFNELERKHIVEHAGSIKGFITDKSVQINGKGKKPFKMLSLHRLLNATNGETGGAINPHINDRRNVIIRCSDELCNDVEYFKKFYSIINNKQVIRKFYDYCYNLDGLETLELPPKTEHHKLLIDSNVCHVKEFIKSSVFGWAAQGLEDVEIMPLTLYNNFKEYIDANGFKYETNTVHLSRKIGFLKIPNSKGKSKGSRCIKFNINELIAYFGLVRNAEHQLIVEEIVNEDNEPEIKILDKIILDRPTNMLVPKDTKEFVNEFVNANAYDNNLLDDNEFIELLLA